MLRFGTFVSGILLFGCRDSLEGTWEGEFTCHEQDYSVKAQFVEQARYEYSGSMTFSYDQVTSFGGESVLFRADLQYDFTTQQTAMAGGQDIYLDMVWNRLYCEVEHTDGTVEEGGCKNVGGIDDADKGEPVGMVQMRFSGSDWMSIDDDNCKGELDLQ